ncbi:DUF1616 domain-containing protein [bacterium]|nr:DUF1616 domain-containing protein [bacterium]
MSILRTNNQVRDIIVEVVRIKKPVTIQQLIQLLQPTVGLSEDELIKLIIDLEKQGFFSLTKKEIAPPIALKNFLFSSNSLWYWIVLALALATTLVVFIITDSSHPFVYLRLILGLIFVLFLPGFVFMKLLCPCQVPIKTSSISLDHVERFVLSVGVSIALVPLAGLILHYTPWGLELSPIMASLMLVTCFLATIALMQEYRRNMC